MPFQQDKVLERDRPSDEQQVKTKFAWQPYFKVLRPRQWTKNLIVFAAPLFSFSINPQTLLEALLAFVLFCFTSSSFYIINDTIDVESDRKHPVKCKRPIASKQITVPIAISISVVLLSFSLLTAWATNIGFGIAITCYGLLQIAYNLKLKHTVILDVIAIATGFVFRALGGAAVTNITLSPWFLLCTAMLALFLGIEKRKAELRLIEFQGGTRRKVLWHYSPHLLSRMESVVTTGTIMTYALWSSGPKLYGASTRWMMITLPFVLYGLFRYQLLSDPKDIINKTSITHEKGGLTERPEEVLLTDKPLLLTIFTWLITTFIVLFLSHKNIIK
jgi:decaprenyl-phosphate phosphoribosyltransferase